MPESHPQPLDLRALFRDHQQEILAKLEAVRSHVAHPGEKGTGTENAWCSVLERYLPARYMCRRAGVVDVHGARSDQIDIVVFDRQYSPLIMNDSATGIVYVPAESVYAALEVKQDLNKGNIEYAAAKVHSVRRLHRTSGEVMTIDGPKRRAAPPRILGGIVATHSCWSPPFGQPLNDALASPGLEARLEIGCALRDGAFELVGPEEAPEFRAWADDAGLIRFLLILLRRLQLLGTAVPMDYAAYEASLERR